MYKNNSGQELQRNLTTIFYFKVSPRKNNILGGIFIAETLLCQQVGVFFVAYLRKPNGYGYTLP